MDSAAGWDGTPDPDAMCAPGVPAYGQVVPLLSGVTLMSPRVAAARTAARVFPTSNLTFRSPRSSGRRSRARDRNPVRCDTPRRWPPTIGWDGPLARTAPGGNAVARRPRLSGLD